MAGAGRAGLPASLWVLGAGVGWGTLTGAVVAAAVLVVDAQDRGVGDVAGNVGLGLLFGAPTGAVLGFGLALLPAVAVAFAASRKQARVAAATAYLPVAVLMLAAQFNDGVTDQGPYAAGFGCAALFGLWRCQRSAALAVGRVTRERAEAVPSRSLDPRPAQAS